MVVTPMVFVVDDDPGMRSSLARLLASAGFQSQTFASTEAFLAEYDPSRPGCLILDVQLGGMSGLDLQDVLQTRGRCPPVIIISGFADIPNAVRATKAGAIDFLEKPLDDVILLDRVERALQQDTASQSEREQRDEHIQRLATLTPRERQTLPRLVAAESNEHIARRLKIKAKTIQTYRTSVLKKLQVNDTTELVNLVYRFDLWAHIDAGNDTPPAGPG